MKVKFGIGLQSQGYEAPRAESVAVAVESILCASSVVKGKEVSTTSFNEQSLGDW